MSTTWLRVSASGLRRTGFIRASGRTPAASACRTCARPISDPSAQTPALFDMFCALNGATRSPRRANHRQSAAVRNDFPASLLQPRTMIACFAIGSLEAERAAGDQEPGLVRRRGSPLAEPTSQIAEAAQERRIGDRRPADLVADYHGRPRSGPQRAQITVPGCEDIVVGKVEAVAYPEGEAVEHHAAGSRLNPGERGGDAARRLEGAPPGPLLPVEANTVVHLRVVAAAASGHENHLRSPLRRAIHRPTALPAPGRASDVEKRSHQNSMPG